MPTVDPSTVKLTEQFTLATLTHTEWRSINNVPDAPRILQNIQYLAERLEFVSELISRPLFVTSAYRCPELNLAVGGSKRSDHLLGLAADFTVHPYTVPELFRLLYSHRVAIDYRQLIFEFGRWCHLSFYLAGNQQLALPVLDTLVIKSKAEGYMRYREGMEL